MGNKLTGRVRAGKDVGRQQVLLITLNHRCRRRDETLLDKRRWMCSITAEGGRGCWTRGEKKRPIRRELIHSSSAASVSVSEAELGAKPGQNGSLTVRTAAVCFRTGSEARDLSPAAGCLWRSAASGNCLNSANSN